MWYKIHFCSSHINDQVDEQKNMAGGVRTDESVFVHIYYVFPFIACSTLAFYRIGHTKNKFNDSPIDK